MPVSKMEAATIRAQLRLRYNTIYGCYEVYSTIHGTGVFRWLKISEDTAKWYKQQFNLQVEAPYGIYESGEFARYDLVNGDMDHARAAKDTKQTVPTNTQTTIK